MVVLLSDQQCRMLCIMHGVEMIIEPCTRDYAEAYFISMTPPLACRIFGEERDSLFQI